jgi:hypothetical protein
MGSFANFVFPFQLRSFILHFQLSVIVRAAGAPTSDEQLHPTRNGVLNYRHSEWNGNRVGDRN